MLFWLCQSSPAHLVLSLHQQPPSTAITLSVLNTCVIIFIVNGGDNQNYISATNTPGQSALRQREERHHTGPQPPHSEKPRTQSHRQTLAQQILGQVWKKSSQTHQRSSLQGLSPLPSGLQPIQRHTSSQNCERRQSRSGLRQPQGQSN